MANTSKIGNEFSKSKHSNPVIQQFLQTALKRWKWNGSCKEMYGQPDKPTDRSWKEEKGRRKGCKAGRGAGRIV